MKKFYAFALASICALSAAAEGRQLIDFSTTKMKVETPAFAEAPMAPAISSNTFKTMAVDFASVADMAGEYLWDFYSPSSSVSSPMLVDVEDASNALQKRINIVIFNDFKIPASVNLTTGTVTITNGAKVGTDDYGDVLIYFKDVDDEGYVTDGKNSQASSIGTIDGSTITFTSTDIWVIGNPEIENTLGIYFMSNQNALTPYTPIQWEDYCTGTFVDGWLVPGQGEDPANYPWTVDIQRHPTVEGVYRIKNPYSCAGNAFGATSVPTDFGTMTLEDGGIVFEINDAELVLAYGGFYSGAAIGSDKLYCFNAEYYYILGGKTKDEIYAIEDFTPSTFANNTAQLRNCVFDLSSSCTTPYVWSQEIGDNMNGSITFDRNPAGIQGIVADSEAETNAPVEYYNLQGMRIQNPASGQIVIRRQGTQAQKVMVR